MLFSQKDSLIQLVKKLPDNTQKVDAWLELAKWYKDNGDNNIALSYCDSIFQLSEVLNYTKGKSKAIGVSAFVLFSKGRNVEALEQAKEGLSIAQETGDTFTIIRRHNLLGMIYSDLELYELSAKNLLQCAQISEQLNRTYESGVAYYNLATVFFDLDNTEKAIKYTQMAIQLLESIDDYSLHCPFLDAMASLTEDPALAKELYLKAKQYCEENDTPYFLTTIYNSLGVQSKSEKQYEAAFDYFRQALSNARTYESREFEVHALTNLGETFYETNQMDSALFYTKQAEVISLESSYQESLQSIYGQIGDIYADLGDYKQANQYNKKAYNIRDTIHQSQVERQIQINADQFQLERKERQIAEQQLQIAKAQNTRNRLLLIGAVLLTFIIGSYQWYLRQQQKRKQKAELALAQQQAEAERLKELDTLKTNFFTNISHELRTPLTLILSPVADLLENAKAIPVREKLGIIKGNAQRLLGLVNEIMDLSKVEAGKLELNESRVALQPIVKRIFYAFESLSELRRINYLLLASVPDIHVLLDREKFEKILHNLLSNAIKYTGAGGEVSLQVEQKNDQLVFIIRDTGQGIHTDDLPHIFDRFYQAKKGETTLQGGTGVGLALSKELSHLLGGSLEVESAFQKGSAFKLVLPCKIVERLTTSEEKLLEAEKTFFSSSATAFAPIAIQGEKPRLLVVEDNPEMGKYLVQILAEQYQCVLATDGLEAIKQLKLARFDCITSDVMMPNMDGFVLRQKINENAAWKHIPFLLLTARHLEEDKIRGFQLGIDDYITKPFSTRELQARIHNLISNKLEREAYAKEEEKTGEEERLNVDEQLLQQLEQEVIARIDDPNFGVEDLAKSIGYSSKQMGRLIKKMTGLTSVGFILEVRLQKARELLEKRLCASVTEAQLEVGISSMSYFTKKFTARFGKNPREVLLA